MNSNPPKPAPGRSTTSCCRSPTRHRAGAADGARLHRRAGRRHPFGTANCCVYLADGTFLEPLAVDDATQASASAEPATCSRRATPPIAATSAMTVSPHWCWRAAMRQRTMLPSSRPGSRPGTCLNSRGRSSMRQARATPLRSGWRSLPILRAGDIFLFACQRLNAPKVDRSALQSHANGAARIGRIVIAANEPADLADLLSVGTACKAAMPANGRVDDRSAQCHGRRHDARGARRRARRRDWRGAVAAAGRYHLRRRRSVGRRGMLQISGRSPMSGANGRLVVPPAAGQGAVFAFEVSR